MSQSEKCKQCGAQLSANEDGSIAPCPRCLMGLGQLQIAETMDHQPGSSAFGSLPGTMGDAFPTVEQLQGQIPDLEIISLIGQGGMGAVYRAKQTSLDRSVALKILAPRLCADPNFVERFTREAQTLAKLDHPNIVTVYNYGQADSMLYLVMEFVDGVNLRQAIRNGSINNKEALAIVPKVCEALQFAHDEGVVHRDIKPENILLDRRGRVKIADFGLAKLTGADAEIPTLTGTRQVLGTINYMAPEQIEGDSVDHRADLYSLGVVFYELLTGELPIGRFAAPSEKTKVGVPLDEVVLKALEKEPRKRYQAASEIKNAVENYSQAGIDAEGNEIPMTPDPIVAATAANSLNGPSLSSGSHNLSRPDHESLHNTPQKGIDSTTTEDSNVSWSLPYTISGLHHGMASATGIMNVSPFSLDLEFQIRDEVVGAIKSKVTTVRVPWASLEQISYNQGMFYDTVVIQANRLNALADMPNNESGRVKLSVKKSNRARGEEIVNQAAIFCQTAPGPGPLPVEPSAVPPGKFQPMEKATLGTPAFVSPVGPSPEEAKKAAKAEMKSAKDKLSSAGGFILAAAILNFVFMSDSLRGKIHHVASKLLGVTDKLGFRISETLENIHVAGNPFSDSFVDPSFDASVFVSIFFFIIYSNACSAKAYWWVVSGCCIALLPIYHAYLFGVAGAVSLLFAMVQPQILAAFEKNDSGDPHSPSGFNQMHGQRKYSNVGVIFKVMIVAAISAAFTLGGIGMLLAPSTTKFTPAPADATQGEKKENTDSEGKQSDTSSDTKTAGPKTKSSSEKPTKEKSSTEKKTRTDSGDKEKRDKEKHSEEDKKQDEEKASDGS